ncbi:putative receptor protein kinase ZmPK1 [Camellia lanceoleosa]|uniref:Receptor protein kinase ZmPK1 n=1 Tax=Camellia lanceoleosa TaxID=1840588 RepID=A0ACC0FR04_9ERIC|nr:putative receptor protein kinase ZmPK1 [Camellia lanceoleosa]
MATLFVFLALYLVLSSPTSSSPAHSLSKSSSLSVEKPDNVLISPNGVFSAGFHPVGVNAYSFAIWFTKTTQNHTTVIWMANRDQPVNGRLSKLSLLKDGNLILTDANNRSIFWATNTASSSLSLQLRLQNSVFDGPETSSNYWPDPWLLSNEANRSSLEETSGNWAVSWQAMSRPCRIHGACGPNSICNFDPSSGRKCSCLPWFKMRNPKDWFDGCEPEFNLSCSGDLKRTVEFTTATKWVFHNGHHSPNVVGMLYAKMPKALMSIIHEKEPLFTYFKFKWNCSGQAMKQLNRTYEKRNQNGSSEQLLWFACALGVLEMITITLVLCYLYRTHKNSLAKHEYYFPIVTATGFRKFSYEELKKATRGFRKRWEEGEEGWSSKATLVKWVMEKVMNRGSPMTSWVGEIVDPMLNGAYDAGKVEKLVEVALQCLEEEKDARPTMTRVVDMLQR